MKNRGSLVLALLTVGLAASMALAQRQGAPPDFATMVQKRVQHLTTLLSLTPAQQQEATTIFTNGMNGAATFHSSMQTAQQSLHTAIKANDQNAITQAANNIGSLVGQMTAAHAKTQAAFYQILTPDQQSKMNELKDEGMGMRFGARGHFMH
jgi:Spy/CpxP family protein refolding chaperone